MESWIVLKVYELLTKKEQLKIENIRHKMIHSKNPLLVWIYYQWMKCIIQKAKKVHYKGKR